MMMIPVSSERQRSTTIITACNVHAAPFQNTSSLAEQPSATPYPSGHVGG